MNGMEWNGMGQDQHRLVQISLMIFNERYPLSLSSFSLQGSTGSIQTKVVLAMQSSFTVTLKGDLLVYQQRRNRSVNFHDS